MKSLLAAAVIALSTPPFPAPKFTGVTADTRCDWGPIASVQRATLVITTDAGPFELMLGSGVKVAGADGKPLASAAELRAGQRVRAYYLVNQGAQAVEIDVLP